MNGNTNSPVAGDLKHHDIDVTFQMTFDEPW